MKNVPISVLVQIDDESVDGHVRYTFKLYAGDNATTEREFIVDVPNSDDDNTDVWVLGHDVEVGDTPEDGFATYTKAAPLHSNCEPRWCNVAHEPNAGCPRSEL